MKRLDKHKILFCLNTNKAKYLSTSNFAHNVEKNTEIPINVIYDENHF